MHGKSTSIDKNILIQVIVIGVISNAFSLSVHLHYVNAFAILYTTSGRLLKILENPLFSTTLYP